MTSAKWFALACVCALVGFFAYGVGRGHSPSGGEGRPVTVPVEQAAYEARVEALTIDRDGWRARFEGVTTLMPDTVYVVDTLVQAPDTILRFVSVDSRGRLGIELLTRPALPTDVGNTVPDYERWQPELHAGIDISACDEGWSVEGGVVACDRPRFGHASLAAVASRSPSIALLWTPSWRSPWEAGISFDGQRWDFRVRRAAIRLW